VGGPPYHKANTTWLTAAVLKIEMTSHISAADVPIWTKFGSRMQNDTPITAKWSRSKPEVGFQYGGRLYFETGSSYISAAN